MWIPLMYENRAFVFFTAVSLICITMFHIGQALNGERMTAVWSGGWA